MPSSAGARATTRNSSWEGGCPTQHSAQQFKDCFGLSPRVG